LTELQEVKIADLAPPKYNPRKDFGKDGLEELADSIRAQGVLTPLLVRPTSAIAGWPKTGGAAEYEIVAGERRYRAAKMAGLKTIPCLVREMTETAAREAQIIENLQRTDITALEEAAGFQTLLGLGTPLVKALQDEGSRAQAKGGVEHLASTIGKSPRYVYARLKLLELADPVKKALEAGKIEPSHAQELVPLKPEQQTSMLKRIEDQQEYGGMSVSQVREEVKYRYTEKPAPTPVSAKEKARRAKEIERQKKADAAWKRQQEKSLADRKRQDFVYARAIAALWPKLKTAGAKDRDWFIDLELESAADANEGMGAAVLVAEGKPLPDVYVSFSGLQAKFDKRSRAERLALVILSQVINRCQFGRADAWAERMFRWAKIDCKKIARELAKQDAEHAKADAARLKKATAAKAAKPAGKKAAAKTAGKKVQISAKSKRRKK
jgi:ParB/RepB/Spo0J family partition protein